MVTTSVPLSTAIADLDDTLRSLIARELSRHALDVEIKFDAPNKEWVAALSVPTINAFLYDLRAAKDHHPVEWEVEKNRDGTREHRPPLMMDASYAFSAWTRAVEDEHRLLSQVLAILNAYPQLPADVLAGELTNQPYPLTAKIARPRADGAADFWSSFGAAHKASLDYTVTFACLSGMTVERGREVRTQTVRVVQADGPRATVLELQRAGGMVHSADGEPVANAWVALPEAGRWTATDAEGRFAFARLASGGYECLVRTTDGQEGHGRLTVPGRGADITVARPGPRAKRRR